MYCTVLKLSHADLVVSVPVVCSSVARSDAVVQSDVDVVVEVEVAEDVEVKAPHYPRTNWTRSWTTTTRKTGCVRVTLEI